jgi:hypothetical protein
VSISSSGLKETASDGDLYIEMLTLAPRDEGAPGNAGGSVMRVLAARFRRAAGAEDGMAIAAVITLIGVGLAVSGAAVVATNTAIGGTTRDERSKDALAAADAAAQVATFRQNQVDTNVSNPCVVEGAGGDLFAGPAEADGWCPEFTGQAGDAEWSYRVSAATVDGTTKEVSVVATGDAEGVTRRINVDSSTPISEGVFGSNSVVGRDGITLDSNSNIRGSSATNGSVELSSNSYICGTVQHGPPPDDLLPAGSQPGGPSCPQSTYPETIGTVNLPPVDPSLLSGATSTNRFFAPQVPNGDTISGSTSDVSWNATNRTLSINSNSSVTIGGNDYNLCRLSMNSNSQLIIAAGAHVRLIFDTPENCNLPAGTAQFEMESNTQLTVTSGNPADLAILVMGSDTIPTTVQMNSNSNNKTFPVIIYAPRSAVELDSNATFLGAVAGKTVHMDSNAHVVSDARASDFQLPILLHYQQDSYVECSSGVTVTVPDDYC